MGGRRERMGENGAGIKHNWQEQNRQVDLKNSIRMGEAKELTCTTYGQELRGHCWREVGTEQRRAKGKKFKQL